MTKLVNCITLKGTILLFKFYLIKKKLSYKEERGYENTIKLKCNFGKINLDSPKSNRPSASLKIGKDVTLSLVVLTQDVWRQEDQVKVTFSYIASLKQPGQRPCLRTPKVPERFNRNVHLVRDMLEIVTESREHISLSIPPRKRR